MCANVGPIPSRPVPVEASEQAVHVPSAPLGQTLAAVAVARIGVLAEAVGVAGDGRALSGDVLRVRCAGAVGGARAAAAASLARPAVSKWSASHAAAVCTGRWSPLCCSALINDFKTIIYNVFFCCKKRYTPCLSLYYLSSQAF